MQVGKQEKSSSRIVCKYCDRLPVETAELPLWTSLITEKSPIMSNIATIDPSSGQDNALGDILRSFPAYVSDPVILLIILQYMQILHLLSM